jgi:RNAse (barnase) inhibitor barstar
MGERIRGQGELDDSMQVIIKLDTRPITDWTTFHEVFAEVLGFPGFYGRNMNAWIDRMTCLDDPPAQMTTVHAPAGGVVVLELEDVAAFARRCPEQYAVLVECTAFVNWRRIETGEPAVLALSFNKTG